MDFEISAQHTEIHPRWREMIDRHLTSSTVKESLLRLHVTLVHSTHHLRGDEEVRLLATMAGRTLRVQKSRANMGDAIHAAFVALANEIESDIAQRRHPEPRIRSPFYRSDLAALRHRGYGFIRTTGGAGNLLPPRVLHHLTFTDLREGLAVQFDVEQGEKGPQAARVYPAAD